MEATDNIQNNQQVFAQYYTKYFNMIQAYIAYRIPHKYEAEDMAQDVFIRLLERGQVINQTTVASFLFTIARNMVTDVLRRYYRYKDVPAVWERSVETSSNITEQNTNFKELSSIYRKQILLLPSMRRKIYELMDCEDWNAKDVAAHLNLSVRTVENHLYIARNEIRSRLNRVLKVV